MSREASLEGLFRCGPVQAGFLSGDGGGVGEGEGGAGAERAGVEGREAGVGRPVIGRGDLSRALVTGGDGERLSVMREVVLRALEAGEVPLIIDFTGAFRPLVRFAPQLRVHRVGSHAALSPFAAGVAGAAKVAALAVQEFYGLSRDERIYLEKAVEAAHAGGDGCPGFRSIRDRLLEAEAEAHPREGYKIEALRHVLWELDTGSAGMAIRAGSGAGLRLPGAVDLSAVPEPRGKALLGAAAFMRATAWGATAIAVERADWLIPRGASREFGLAMEGALLRACCGGALVIMGAPAAKSVPDWLADSATAVICCGGGPLKEGGRHAGVRHGSVSATASVGRLCVPALLKFSETAFGDVGEGEVDAHMEALGEGAEPLKAPAPGGKLLEGIFADRRSLVYAVEVLRLIRGGRIPVDAVSRRSGVALRRVIRALQKRFLIVEQADSSGAYWYRLTKAGERALAEIDENGGSGDESEADV